MHPECVNKRAFLIDMLTAVFSFLFVIAGSYLVAWALFRHPPEFGEYASVFINPYAFPERIRVFSIYPPFVVAWIMGVKAISESELLRYGPVTTTGKILDALSLILLLIPILVALICWPLDLNSGINFSFKAFGGGLLFSFCYFVYAAWMLSI